MMSEMRPSFFLPARTRYRRLLSFLVLMMLVTIGGVSGARADWINLTGAETAPNIAEITILDDRVRIALEIYVRELAKFEALVPDDLLKTKDVARPSVAERLKRFSAETFQVVTGDGIKLPLALKLAEPRLRKDRESPFAGMINPMTRQRVPAAPKDKRVLYVELDYLFEGKPKTLTFIPPQDDKGIATATIGFIAYHKAVPIIDFRYLSESATVILDWTDPWYTKFDNPNLKRHHKSAQMSFLYVEPREVRHEVLVRVRDLQDWTTLSLDDDTTISATEQGKVKKRAREFFMKKNPLHVDGIEVAPVGSRAEFVNVSLSGLEVVADNKPIELSTAIIGVILSYPVKQLPKNVSVHWELFNERVQRIPATAIDPAGPLLSYIDADAPVLEWKNFLLKYNDPQVFPVIVNDGRTVPIPLLSLVLAFCALVTIILAIRPRLLPSRSWAIASALTGVSAVLLTKVAIIEVANPIAGAPSEVASSKIVSQVLDNLNHAFVEKDPSALRNAMNDVVSDDALDEVEAEIGRALAIKVAGGGIARVDAIENLELKETVALDNHSGFRTLAEWTAKASAGHWGHQHRRTIRFRALMELVNVDGIWKLAGITVVDAKQQT